MLKILILTAAVLLSENSQACSCAPESLEEAFAKYNSVFRGTVSKIVKGKESTLVHFKVDTVWKGKPGKALVTATANSPAACGYSFVAKKEYVVFAWKDGKSPHMTINTCSKTAPADEANETLAWLDQHHSPDDGDQ